MESEETKSAGATESENLQAENTLGALIRIALAGGDPGRAGTRR